MLLLLLLLLLLLFTSKSTGWQRHLRLSSLNIRVKLSLINVFEKKFVLARFASVYPFSSRLVLLNCKNEEQLELLLATIPDVLNTF